MSRLLFTGLLFVGLFYSIGYFTPFFSATFGGVSAHADFYEKDYAKAPGGISHNQTNTSAQVFNKSAISGRSQRQLAPVNKAMLDAQNGEIVLELGVLVNGTEAVDVLSKLSEIVRSQSGWKFGPIAVANGDATLTTQLNSRLSGLMASGAQVLPARHPLLRAAQVSPTWFIGTAKGYHMLEGLVDPLAYVNSRGEFVAPDLLLEKLTPISAEGESF